MRTKVWNAVMALVMAVLLFLAVPARAAAAGPSTPLDLNLASVEQLVDLPGIGPRRAADIVRARENRRFDRVSDLMRVRGIGRRTYLRLKPLLKVEARAASSPRGAAGS